MGILSSSISARASVIVSLSAGTRVPSQVDTRERWSLSALVFASNKLIVRMISIESKVRVVVRVHREWNAKTVGGCD